MSEDASATYRGFRNQALYVLHRLLTDANSSERIYRPEGAEDLAVFDERMRLVEVVQVKDYSSDLALSHFKPKSEEGFFARLSRRQREQPDCTTRLASFGPLGPELGGAITGDSKHRTKVVEKLCASNASISAAAATAMLDALRGNVVHPVAADLHASTMHALQGTNVTGDLECSLELLMYWVFDASEKQRALTRQGLLLQLQRIGSYLAALRDTSSEWGVSVCPVSALTLTSDDAARWRAEYRRGVQARWEHIVAGADCVRAARLAAIHRQFQHHPVVIVRGASGQGKSTIAWRYLYDNCAEGLRFHVRMIEGREHARRIANALGAHVKRLNLKAVAFVDVSPADAGWNELVAELVAAGLRVLIAIREEDFRRANIAVGDYVYSEVVLDRVTIDEAELIFSALRSNAHANALDFEEAWTRFASEDGGPLLEFTHLVTEGETLTSRIAAQIRRIQNDAATRLNGFTEAHLELLALSAVANEAGARVSLAQLCRAVGANPLTGPLKTLENEYLLRVQNERGDASVAGLHALRSRAVVCALFGEDARLLEKYIVQALPLVVDEDLETFLLASFSRHAEFGDVLFRQLCQIAPRSWTHAGGIARALIWEGVSRYERRNQQTLLAVMAKYGQAWWMVCDSLIGMDANSHRERLERLSGALQVEVPTVSLTPKAEVFDLFVAWARDAVAPPAPRLPREWMGVGDVAHWLGHVGGSGALRAAVEKMLPTPLPADLHVEELAQFIGGRAMLADPAFPQWLDAERQAITEKFLLETDSIYLADDGHEVKVFFSVPLASSVTANMPDAHDWHEQTMKRVRLLRLLFPNRETFGAQGIGLECFLDQLQHDPTHKQIPARSLPLERSIRLNAIFGSLVEYRHIRPNTWKEYAVSILEFRESASAFLRRLHRAWDKLLSESTPSQSTIRAMPGEEIDRLKSLSNRPMFPRTAVDEWGFISEEKQQADSDIVETMQRRSLQRFDAWRKSYRDFKAAMEMVASKTVDLTRVYVSECNGHIADDEDDKTGHLLLINLSEAWEQLPTMQREFRTRFGSLLEQRRIDAIDAHEHSNFRHLWAVAFAMRYERQHHLAGTGQLAEAEVNRRRARFIQSLKTEVSAVLAEAGTATVRDVPWLIDEVPHLCVVCDYRDLDAMAATPPSVVMAIWRAAQIGGWRLLEWKPLQVTWPKIAIVNLVNGKALLPACATISTLVLFGASEGFEAKPHHYTPIRVQPDDFAKGGFTVWDSPLLRAALTLQANILEFMVTNARFHQLVNLILEQDLGQSDADRILGRFSRELTTVFHVAQTSYGEMAQILDATHTNSEAHWKDDLGRLCRSLLCDVDDDEAISITLDKYTSWAEGLQAGIVELQRLISEIVGRTLVATRA